MTRFACFAFVGVALVVACGGETATDPAAAADAGPHHTAATSSSSSSGGATDSTSSEGREMTCDELLASASQRINAALATSVACTHDSDCQVVAGGASCVGACGTPIATASLASFQAVQVDVSNHQCAAAVAKRCQMFPLGCPVPVVPRGVSCVNNVCAGQFLVSQPDGSRTGDGTTCTFGPAYAMATPPTFPLGTTGILSPNGCQTCVCTDQGLACAGECLPGALIACDAWARTCPDGSTVSPQPPDCAAPACK